MILNPKSVPFSDLSIVIDEDTPYRTVTVILQDISAYNQLVVGDEFEIHLGGVIHRFLVVAKERSITPSDDGDSIVMTVRGASPAIVLTQEYAKRQDYVITDAISAKDFVEMIVDEVVEWNIIDWMIPAGRIQFRGVFPLEAIYAVLNPVKAVLQSKADGTLYVQYLYPIPTTQYASAIPVYTYADNIHNIVERDVVLDGANKFRIMDATGGYADSLTWELSEESKVEGTLKFIPSPWRETCEVIQNLPVIQVLTGTLINEQITETIEFRNGIASASQIVAEMLSVNWITPSLGAITIVPYTRELSVNSLWLSGYGVAVVSYRTSYYSYSVKGVGLYQFLVREV